MTLGVHHINATAQYRYRRAARSQCAVVSGTINAQSQTADHTDTGLGQIMGTLPGPFAGIGCRVTAANQSHHGLFQHLRVAVPVHPQGRIRQAGQGFGVATAIAAHDALVETVGPFQQSVEVAMIQRLLQGCQGVRGKPHGL